MNKIDQSFYPRDPAEIGRIVRKRGVCGSKPVFAGTRVRVAVIHHFLEDGASVEEILRSYPGLTESDVNAAIAFDKGAAA